MIRQSLTLRVLALTFLLIALPLLVDSFIFFKDSYKDAIGEAKNDLREVASLHTFTLEAVQPVEQPFLKEVAYLLALNKSIDQLDLEKVNKELEKIAQVEEDFQLFLLSPKAEGPNYSIVASSVPAVRGKEFFSAEQLSQLIREKEGVFFRYIYIPEKKAFVPYIFIVRNLYDKKSGELASILMVSADIREAITEIFSEMGTAAGVQFALLTEDSVAFASSDPRLNGDYFSSLSPQRKKEIVHSKQLGDLTVASKPLPVVKKEDPPFFEFIFEDRVQIGYIASIPELKISLLAYSNKEIFFNKAIRHFLLIYCVYGIILLGGGAFAYWISQYLSRPLRQLSQGMEEVSRGNLDVRFKKEPLGFEINLLGEIFNETLQTLLDGMHRAQDERVKKETYQKEVAIGREVQQSLMPSSNPHVEGASVVALHRPAREAGGTYYSYLKRTIDGEEVLFFSVADAAGMGVSACLYALAGRSLVQTYATYLDDVGEILSNANNTFLRDTGETGMFMTVILGAYHTRSKRLNYYSCGHIPGVIRRQNGELEPLNRAGAAIGLEPSEIYRKDEVQLASGDCVLFFTEGLIQVVNGRGEALSEERLHRFFREEKWQTAKQIVSGLDGKLAAFTEGKEQEEEVIVVALEVE